MSQTYDPNEGPGYPTGPGYAGGTGYPGDHGYGFASAPPPPPPHRNHKRGLLVTGAVALAAGAAAGGLIGSMNHSVASLATATSKTVLSTSQIASRVDPGLVDVVSTDGYQQASSAGTGIVLTSDGKVLTNNHVIEGATSIKVTDIGNGRTYTAKVVGYDASHDVAVLQLQNAHGLTTASLGDSSTVQVGDKVVGLGNAGGKGGTPSVAAGTVTALNQSITASDEMASTSEQLTGLIQTNANIQPGDSGGPLANSYGQVIGMDTAASSGYQFQGQSSQSGQATQAYAIPINEAVSIASQIEAGHGSSTIHIGATAFLGVSVQPQSSSSDSGNGSGDFGGLGGFGGFGGQGSDGQGSSGQGSSGQGSSGQGSSGQGSSGQGSSGQGSSGQGSSGQSTSGVSVAGTVSGSPAANAGLAQGDVITALGGQSVSTPEDITAALVKYHPGDRISISWVDQSGQSQTATVTLATGPAA